MAARHQRGPAQRVVPARPTVRLRQAILLPATVAGLALSGCSTADGPTPSPLDRGAAAAAGSQPAHATAGGTPATGTTATGIGQAARPAGTGSGCAHGSGFALSLASGYAGWATPAQAAQQFSRHGNPAGYGTVRTVWTAGATDTSGVSLTAGHLTLHAVRLLNGRWAIDSGQRCD